MTPLPTMVDVLRGLVAGLAMMVSGSTMVVFGLYVRAWRQAPSGSGIIPRHVAFVSLGTLLLVAGVGWGIYQTIGDDPTFNPRLVSYFVALLLILVAVVDIGDLQRRRLRKTGKHHRKS